jgi:hypothetical protein
MSIVTNAWVFEQILPHWLALRNTVFVVANGSVRAYHPATGYIGVNATDCTSVAELRCSHSTDVVEALAGLQAGCLMDVM